MGADDRIATRIRRLRALIVNGLSKLKSLHCIGEQETITVKLWNDFWHETSTIWPRTLRLQFSVEDEVLSAMVRHGSSSEDKLNRVRHEAILQARGALFDHHISESLVVSGWGNLLTMRRAHLAAMLMHDPFCITTDHSLASALAEGIDKHGIHFLKALTNIRHNLDRRSKRVSDDCLYVLATNWVNPHCPLWLMTRHAIHKACVGLSTGLEVTESMIQERLKSLNFLRTDLHPIGDVKLDRKKRIEGFVVSKKFFDLIQTREFTNACGREYRLLKPRARHRSYTRREN